MKKEQPIGLMVKRINTIFETEINKELSKLNLTRSQLEILIFICFQTKQRIEVNQINIEKNFNLTNPTVTGILNRLEEKKYIQRVPSEKNARFKKIIITEEAIQILKKGDKQRKIMEEKVMKCLSDDEQKKLKEILEKIIENIILEKEK